MKPSIPKGVRDFSPGEVLRRQYIFDTIRSVFIRYGYQPIETPTMETLDTLTGKYGEEGDRLLFKVLNNGDFLAKADEAALEARDSHRLVPSISKRGLRYDLTVPFARFVVMHQNEITFPFKRYQIQPVWRADRPQKGRYQEFYQCDVDVVGSDSLMYEAELVKIYDDVFHLLGLRVVIRMNNRKILAGIAEAAGIPDQFQDMTTAIDKLDKIGPEGVREELMERGISAAATTSILDMLDISGLDHLKEALSSSESGLQGIGEVEQMQGYLRHTPLQNTFSYDVTLARGLNYYTGCIFEVNVNLAVHPGIKMGSIGGGGRYDDLTGIFGMKGTSGVGISFGAERIYDVLEELELFPVQNAQALNVVLIAFDEDTHRFAFGAAAALRAAGINADLYPEPAKLKKQMKYANDRQVPYTILIGAEEARSGKLTLKNMHTGEQALMSLEEIISLLRG